MHMVQANFALSSSANKALLLNVDGFLAVLVDNLLLSSHPAQQQPDFEAVRGPVQRVRLAMEMPVLPVLPV